MGSSAHGNTVPGARRAAFGLIRAVTTKVGVIALLLVGGRVRRRLR
ncbi:hypothetical protein [Micromonospora haikouensis]|nr:hypothetical protein [Micromonospora haikouensis]